ncbi:MAG TPA: 1,2-phenylacetyl-CoA epoxidase subunit PaaD [Steroidobacteraceae bacterium]|nr:1,2-phenylacetyl-CoA epoxidase subunit PaaD [Steroidobacteraceae bacterium]
MSTVSAASKQSGLDVLHSTEREVWGVLERVPDPEIPVLSVVDLGIIRHVRVAEGSVHVGVSPTYSGCPATEVIRSLIGHALRTAGFEPAQIEDVLSPPWSSDWISTEGHRKLKAFGIAPPEKTVSRVRHLFAAPRVACPRCDSTQTERISEFGSTPCKAHYRCLSCAEPFDHFKCI